MYAAGLILFEMLTGTKAFTGDPHPRRLPARPRLRAGPVVARPSVPSELDALVALATARDPDQRPADADAFLAQVRASHAC